MGRRDHRRRGPPLRADADDDRRALSAFRDAGAYERGRPGWPEAAVDVLCAAVGAGPEAVVADLGAGTGKLTRLLVPRVARVVAVEPSAPMLAALRELVPQAAAVAGTAEDLPLGDASVRAVFAAEAFHWFGSARVVAELARVIEPGGGLALLWNDATARPAIPVLQRHADRRSFPYGEGRWRVALEASPAFGRLHRRAFVHEQRLDRDAFVAQVASLSWIQALGEAERAEVLEEVRAAAGDEVVIPYRTSAFWARRAAGG